jgi:tetratricopeptide (TPR) repeat protein
MAGRAAARRVHIAWLPEDETTPSFWKFLLRILRALNAGYGDEFPPPPREQFADAPDDRRSAVLTDSLLKELDGRTLLVVVENLDDVMRSLKDEGQKRWRAFLQEHPVAATLATAQQLTEDVSDRGRPFFNFFQVEHLQPLTADEALALLRKIAEHSGNTDLSAFLQTPTGRARVRAIRHIAGGSHRVFIILSEFATRENLDDLVTAFEELLDELTPYYQERLRWLPDPQREIVEFLCRQPRTVPVKEITGELFLTEQTAAAQLKQLNDKGYVTPASVGRESRYELAEPLMRLCVEVKDPQREPIRLIVEFLRIWYDPAGVKARLQGLPADADLERRYFHAALQAYRPDIPGPVEEALKRDLEAARATGDPEEVVRVLVELAATADSVWQCVAVAGELGTHGRYAEALAAWERAIELDPKNAMAWINKGYTLNELGRPAEALAACDWAIELDLMVPVAWNNKGASLNKLGRYAEALAACQRVIEVDPKYVHAWSNRGRAKLGLGQIGEAADDFRHAIELDGNLSGAFEGLAEAQVLQGNWAEAERVLPERFRLPSSTSNPAKSSHLPDLIATIFRASTDRRVWAHQVGRLVDIAREAQEDWEQKKAQEKAKPTSSLADTVGTAAPPNPLAVLGDALVRSLTKKTYAEAPTDALDAWAGVWREVAERHPDLSLATRLFGVGVRYLQTRDERVLLDLVQEERSILRDLFRLDDDTDEG